MLTCESLIDALDNARILCIELNFQAEILSFSAACERVLGYTRKDVLHRKIWEFMAFPDEVELVKKAFTACPTGEFPQGFVDHYRTKNGDDRLIAWSTTVANEAIVLIGRDITERGMVEQRVEKQAAWFRLLLEQVPAIVWTSDKNFKITSSTGSGLAGLRLKSGQLEDTSLFEYLHTSDLNMPEVVAVKRALEGETTRHESLYMGRTFESIIQPLRDDEGKITGAIGLAVDVTERRKMEDSIRQNREELRMIAEKEKQARLEAERLSRIKDEFLITLSHELRTPLVPILGWIELLEAGDVDDGSFQDALKAIERNAKSELQLIEDLLDLSRIISGKMVMELVSIDLEGIFCSALDTMKYMAEAKHIELAAHVDDGSFMMNGDATRLQQVIWNIVGNSIKFTPNGGHIDVRLRRDWEHFILTVKDDGIGIPPDVIPHVFERFRQADGSVSRRFGGLGIGLSLVRHIVESHGGRVSAESEGEGKGAMVTVSLPVTSRQPNV